MNPDRIPFREVLRVLTDLAASAGVEMLLIGATARDIALRAEGHDAPVRATNDVDIAVAAEDSAAFTRLTSPLTPARKGAAHKFLVEAVEVDIVPFGGIESQDRTISWPDGAVMNTLGFAEAIRSALQIDLGDDRTVLVASLAAQTALKLFAWTDRKDLTERDAVDLRTLIHAYSDAGRLDDIYAEGNLETLARYDYEVIDTGAHLLGADIRAQLGDLVAKRCIQTLNDNESDEFARISHAMRGEASENARLLAALRAGLGSSK